MERKESYIAFVAQHLLKLMVLIILVFHFSIGDFSSLLSENSIEIVESGNSEKEKDAEEKDFFVSTFSVEISNSTNFTFNDLHELIYSKNHFSEIPSPPPDQA